MRRLTRKKLKQDEFISVVDEMVSWITDNWRPLAAALGAVCLVAVIWWGVTLFGHSRTEKAAYDLYQAVQLLEGSQSPDNPVKPDPDAAKVKLQAIVDQYGRSDQADVARVYLGRMATDNGDTDTASQLFRKVAQRHRGDAIGRLATLDLIHLRVSLGQGAEVASELQAMAAGSDRRLPRDVALYELGSLFLKEQKPERAREYFQKLVDDLPDSPYQPQAQQRLRELG